MSVPVKCPKCGMTQMAKDACKGCGKPLPAPAPSLALGATAMRSAAMRSSLTAVAAAPVENDPVFERDRFLLRQRAWTIHEKYEVWDEQGRPILYVERPGHHLRALGALLAGLAAGGLAAGVCVAIGVALDALWPSLLGLLAAAAALILVMARLAPRRHIQFYRDESRAERLLEVLQDQTLALFTQTFTVRDAAGGPIARIVKRPPLDVIRKKWRCFAADGRELCVAKEALWHAIVSRVIGKLFPMNFEFFDGGGRPLGRFDRQFTLLDRYVLDLTADRTRSLDRRVALAIGVLLDTGERR